MHRSLVASITSRIKGLELSSFGVHTITAHRATNVTPENFPDVPEGDYVQLPASVHGFELKSKSCQSCCLEEISDIMFDETAWDHLVVDDDVKSLIKGLVDVTNNANTSQLLMSDVITGKGGGLIAVLHRPPGTGKILTASQLEYNLSEILNLATTWNGI